MSIMSKCLDLHAKRDKTIFSMLLCMEDMENAISSVPLSKELFCIVDEYYSTQTFYKNLD